MLFWVNRKCLEAEEEQANVDDSLCGLMEVFTEQLKKSHGAFPRGHRVLTVSQNLPPDLILAALSLALFAVSMQEPVQFVLRLPRTCGRRAFLAAWRASSSRARALTGMSVTEPMFPRAGGYSWISSANSPMHRMERIAHVSLTLQEAVHFSSIPDLVEGTSLYWPGDCPPTPDWAGTSWLYEEGTGVEVATRRARSGQAVALVSAASAYKVGGGFFRGGRHASEEALCTQSTLIFSLLAARRQAQERRLCDCSGVRIHIPEDGVVVSPGVEVFRHGSSQGYATDERTWLAGVLSVSMPNLNPSVRDSPVDVRPRADRQALVERKIHATLQGALSVGATVLVVPDVGCGAFGHHPTLVGEIFGRVLTDYYGCFSEVVMVGDSRFFESAEKVLGHNFQPAKPRASLVSSVHGFMSRFDVDASLTVGSFGSLGNSGRESHLSISDRSPQSTGISDICSSRPLDVASGPLKGASQKLSRKHCTCCAPVSSVFYLPFCKFLSHFQGRRA